ncbi:MAG: universal stress protein [Halobacteriaceae archaeon]
MGLYERILVPTDGSAGMERVIEHAVELAADQGATIYAVYVINTASYASLSMDSSWEGVAEMLEQEGETALEEVIEIAETRDVSVETIELSGTPSQEIVRYAQDKECDLIIMGTHGRGGIDRLLLGSVAEKVVRTATVPVLTMRVGESSES